MHLLTCPLRPSVYSPKGDFSKVQSSPQNIPTPNCPVTCLHLHVTFLAQLRHTPVTPFSTFQVLLPSTRVSWTLFAPFPNYGSFFKNEVCITLQEASPAAPRLNEQLFFLYAYNVPLPSSCMYAYPRVYMICKIS